MSQLNTGGPSCEIIILRNKSRCEILTVCIGIITTAPKNKKYSQILNKNTSTYIREVYRASLMYVINLEVDSSLKWVLSTYKAVRYQAMHCGSKVRYFYWEFDRIFLFLRAVINIPIKTLIISPWLFFRKMIISQLELGPLLSRVTEKSSTDKHSTETSIVVKTKECASLYVRKLGAAGIAQILLVVVNIPVVHKSVASEARLNISHQRRDLLSTCFLVFFIPFYLNSLL